MSLSLLGWVVLGLPALAWADAPSLPPDRAVALALTAHPDLRAAEQQVALSRADRSAASVLRSNPQLYGWSTPDGTRGGFSASQPLSLSGAGWHTRSAARHGLQGAEARLERARRTLAASVLRAYVQAVVATGQVRIARDGAELAGRLRYAVGRKHDEGEASTLDLRLARLGEVQASNRLLQARRQQAEALATLADWVLEPVDATALVPDPLQGIPEPAATARDRSDVRAAEAELAAARARLREARADTLPPIQLGVSGEIEQGTTHLGPSLQVTVPLFDRNQRARADGRSGVDVASSGLAATRARATTEQQVSAPRLDEAEAALDGTEADVDEARAALASIEAGVLAGEVELADAVLLQAQVLQGQAAVVQLRGLVAEARIDRMLAVDDDALVGGAR